MTSTERVVGRWIGITLAVIALGCSSESTDESGLEPPTSLLAQTLSKDAIQLSWTAPASGDVINFVVQRRENLEGRFTTLATVRASAGSTYLDGQLAPSTFYGYRLITVDRLGNQSGASTVAGALTAPAPGIRVITGQVTDPFDPNGYHIAISGPFDTATNIGVSETRIFSPLPAGDYTVALTDLLATCSLAGDSTRTVSVTDQGLNTLQQVRFDVSCLDPNRGRIVAIVDVTGDSTDVDGYRIDYTGIVPGDTVPAVGGVTLSGTGGSGMFQGLKPGDYEVTIGDIEGPCTNGGVTARTVAVEALSVDTVRFAVTCPTKDGGSGPLIWRNTFAPQSAAAGQTVTLDVAVDLTALPGQDFGAAQAVVTYDPSILTYVSATVPAPAPLNNLTVNSSTPGTLGFLNLSTGAPGTGVVPLARFTFQVKAGASGSSTSHTTIQLAAAGDGSTPLEAMFRVVEDTFTVGSGGGSNQSPTAHANGPYSGTAGAAISFSSSGSSDPDGSIASYGWAFGDGATSTSANPTHSYSAAGSYTAILTVTDNQSAQGTSQATVTVTGGGGGNQSPIAAANGPYTGTAGASISFSSAGSSDPDGTIASYSWNFGDGGSSTAQNPAHSYTAAGSYTATLTVTDNLGGTGSGQATVTVTSASSTAFTWTNAFGGFEPVLGTYPLSITLNLATDIPETTGPEALGSFTVDSIVWDPAVLEYHSLAFGSGGGSFNTTNATGGCKCKLLFNGSPTSNTGVVAIATVRFKPVGPSGATITTVTGLGPMLSTPALGSFNYRSKIQVVEGKLTLP